MVKIPVSLSLGSKFIEEGRYDEETLEGSWKTLNCMDSVCIIQDYTALAPNPHTTPKQTHNDKRNTFHQHNQPLKYRNLSSCPYRNNSVDMI